MVERSMSSPSQAQTLSELAESGRGEVRAAGGMERVRSGEGARQRVLIADDVAAILNMFQQYFAGGDFDLVLASSGEEAIEKLRAERFSVVVTDLRMSPGTGLEVIQFVKEHFPEVEVIVLTGYASVESTLDAIRYHVFDYVEKPVNLEKFSRILTNALEKARLAAENKRLLELLQEQNARLERRVREVTRELQELSTRDALTGLFNYRYFLTALAGEVSRTLRYGRAMSLAMLDLDHFKLYNDTHGHQAGNEALVQLGKTLRRQTRENDVCVRYGGEEFAIILPETGKEAAAAIVERIRGEIEELGLEYEAADGSRKRLTASAGVASCPTDAQTDQSLVQRADAALYRAKSLGRDQLCVV